ncbi:Sulfite reductase [NADPH] flavoprotein alpha-component [Coccomyxa sp. Obi]|nr:Sulfite reductase [NADPH] flavoprotein alpha-component [Coccomyxa sp. Obi]
MAERMNSWLRAGLIGAPVAWYVCSRLCYRPPPKETSFDAFLRPGAKTAKPQGKEKQRPAANFSAFLKRSEQEQTPVRQAASFSSFLRKQPNQAQAQPAAAAAAADADGRAAAVAVPAPEQKPVAVLYGTEYGFSKEIAEKLVGRLKESGEFWPRLLDMADHPEGYPLDSEQALLVVCSTQGDGVPPSEAREFCDWLAGSAAPKVAGLSFSVCALGDTSYTHFSACGKAVDARLEALGGARCAPRADINREDWKAVDAWIEAAIASLLQLPLKTFGQFLGSASSTMVQQSAPKQKRWGKQRPYYGTVVAIEGLCNITSAEDKDTIRVEVDLGDSALTYIPGDALGILPTNCPQVVEELLHVLGADGEAQVPVPAWHYEEAEPRNGATMLLHEALSKCYDLRSPKPELLQLLLSTVKSPALTKEQRSHENGYAITNGKAHVEEELPNGKLANGHAANGLQNGHAPEVLQSQEERLRELIASGESSIEAYFEPRHVADVLQDFSSAKPALTQVLATLRPLLPRLYSISSSMLEAERRVQVTVATVRYQSLGRARIGVTSTYLAERLKVGDKVPVYIHKNPDFRLPTDPARPIIMVGPGTGLAPFRAFMQERLLSRADGGAKLGEAVLYFGCRRSDQDYLYGDLLKDWAAKGDLTLFTAFSRQQAHKVYVQDRLRESGDLVWGLLEAGAHFYVCGDAAHMAGAVEEALLTIIESSQGKGPDAARAYLAQLTAQQRYQRDIWY